MFYFRSEPKSKWKCLVLSQFLTVMKISLLLTLSKIYWTTHMSKGIQLTRKQSLALKILTEQYFGIRKRQGPLKSFFVNHFNLQYWMLYRSYQNPRRLLKMGSKAIYPWCCSLAMLTFNIHGENALDTNMFLITGCTGVRWGRAGRHMPNIWQIYLEFQTQNPGWIFPQTFQPGKLRSCPH